MANYCKGALKIRGTKEEVRKFLLEAVLPYPNYEEREKGETVGTKVVAEGEDYLSIVTPCAFYLKDTRLNTIESKEIYHEYENDDLEICVLEEYTAAYGINTSPLADLSKEYNVDIKVYGFDATAEYNRDVEIIKGKVVKDELIKFKNYRWECITPTIGG